MTLIPRFKDRNAPKCLVLALIGVVSGTQGNACDSSGDPLIVTADCNDLIISTTKADVTIAPSITVSPLFVAPYDAVRITGSGAITGTFLVQGNIISGSGRNGLVNEGTIATLVNEGLMRNDTSSPTQAALLNRNNIGTVINRGTISATVGTFGNGAHAILQDGTIGTLENSGIISAQNSAIHLTTGLSARIDTLINTGRIEGGQIGGGTNTFASAIELSAGNSIGTIINTGVIDHSVCNGPTCYAAIDNQGGTIGTITNLGRLTSGNTSDNGFGIINGVTGSIGTLNNDQVDLKFYGKLPQSYMAIIYGASNYGKLAVTNGSGLMSFGVDAAAPLGSSTYTAVLSGIAADNLDATSGTWGGGLFNNTWTLTPAAPTVWDLNLTSTAIVPSVETGSGQAIADAIVQTVTENLSDVVPPGAIVPTLQNGVTLQQAAQTLTTGQANQLSTASAEGYSSNLTIGLLQMGRISETTADRLSCRQPADRNCLPHRGVWVDSSASLGRVDGHDGRDGFSYGFQSIIMGADVLNGASGGMGLFAAFGHSGMTESDFVPQDFSTTRYALGFYGEQDLSSGVTLAGSLGYMLGETAATRHTMDIGQFAGGAQVSNFTAQGVFGTVKLTKASALKAGGTVRRFAGLTFAQLHMNRAVETGAGDFGYFISDAASRSAVLFVGGDFSVPLSRASGMNLVGFAKVGYDIFAGDDEARTITATSDLFGAFDQVGADPGPLSGTLGIGVEGQIARGISGRFGLVASLTGNGQQVGLGGELRW